MPEAAEVERLVQRVHARFKDNDEGENSRVYPALERVPRDLFGICVAGTSGRIYAAGRSRTNSPS
ncbi:hypothetical protein [Xanthobacter sp.]|uniref:hypothetical protein n=1 Tax=Xanthobacter sp. TaxID=35809 RepID=UPI00345B8CEE